MKIHLAPQLEFDGTESLFNLASQPIIEAPATPAKSPLDTATLDLFAAQQLPNYQQRVHALEAAGLTTSDAQGAADAELITAAKPHALAPEVNPWSAATPTGHPVPFVMTIEARDRLELIRTSADPQWLARVIAYPHNQVNVLGAAKTRLRQLTEPRGKHTHKCLVCGKSMNCYKAHCTKPQRINKCAWCH